MFRKNDLKYSYLWNLLKKYWYAPCDPFLRAPEIAIWKHIIPRKPVLTIGCSDGQMDNFLFEHIIFDYGLDNNIGVYKDAANCGLYKKVIIAEASKIPLKSNSIKTIISNSTFEHINNDVGAIKEVSRILEKKGEFIFTVPNKRFVNTLKGIGLNETSLKEYNTRVEHYHYRSRREWGRILNKYGLKLKINHSYFSERCMRFWWILFRITTFKINKRELWSYLRDSKYSVIIPGKLIALIYFLLLLNIYKKAYEGEGCWSFYRVVKI